MANYIPYHLSTTVPYTIYEFSNPYLPSSNPKNTPSGTHFTHILILLLPHFTSLNNHSNIAIFTLNKSQYTAQYSEHSHLEISTLNKTQYNSHLDIATLNKSQYTFSSIHCHTKQVSVYILILTLPHLTSLSILYILILTLPHLTSLSIHSYLAIAYNSKVSAYILILPSSQLTTQYTFSSIHCHT